MSLPRPLVLFPHSEAFGTDIYGGGAGEGFGSEAGGGGYGEGVHGGREGAGAGVGVGEEGWRVWGTPAGEWVVWVWVRER